ncbi:hypothetical protein JOM56_006050 [Amanita muscaria]
MTSTTDERCEQLSEQELRRLYDEEEAERFLHFFSNYVTEVQVLDKPIGGKDGSTDAAKPNQESTGGPTSTDISLSETIALHFVVPLLLPANSVQPPPPPFTISRCSLTVQRLFLALEPLYYPLIINLIHLATWTNKGRSMRYCVIFWMLWWHDLLLPSLALRVLYSLLRRRIFAYPTYAELLERRRQIDKAAEIGDDLSAQLTKSTYSLQDPWKLYKFCLSLVKRNGGPSKSKAGDSCPNLGESSTVSDDTEDNKRTEEVTSVALHVLNQISDLHERVQNIFIWRQPASSSQYGALLVLVFLLTFFVPARYLSKLAYFGCGFAFWHVIPVIAALPPGSLSRIPPPFVNVPTNAEFAMQLISRRVADGHSVTPQKPAKVHSRSPSETLQTQNQDSSKIGTRSLPQDRIDWSKWGNRIAAGKSWASQQRQPVNGNMEADSEVSTDSVGNGESHAYPAQCRAATGLLTVTSNSIYFTPALSTSAKIEIPFPVLRNVKKSDMLTVRGLKIRWMDATTNSEQEEHFIWVGGRDELFARLVGHGRGRWLKV